MPSYEQNKSSKLWSVRFREIDDTGESHQKRLSGYKTKKEAQYGYQEVTQKAWDRDRSVASFIFWCGDIPALALTLACDALINFKCGREGVKIFPKQRRAFSPTHSCGIQG